LRKCISIGNSDTISVSPFATTIYYVREENGICGSNCISHTIIIIGSVSGPGTVTAYPNPVCSTQASSISLTGTLSIGGEWLWYSGSCGTGGTLIGTGYVNSFTVYPTIATTYYVRQDSSGYHSGCGAVLINVNTLSVQATSLTTTPATICQGASVVLGITGGTAGTGASWKWYTGSCGGSLIATGISTVQYPTVTTTYFVRAEGSCNSTLCSTNTVTVNILSVNPTSVSALPSTICTGDMTTLNVNGGSLGTGAVWKWYTGSCNGTNIGTGTTFSVSPSVNTTFYLRAEGSCNTASCFNTAVTVNTLSVAPAQLHQLLQ